MLKSSHQIVRMSFHFQTSHALNLSLLVFEQSQIVAITDGITLNMCTGLKVVQCTCISILYLNSDLEVSRVLR